MFLYNKIISFRDFIIYLFYSRQLIMCWVCFDIEFPIDGAENPIYFIRMRPAYFMQHFVIESASKTLSFLRRRERIYTGLRVADGTGVSFFWQPWYSDHCDIPEITAILNCWTRVFVYMSYFLPSPLYVNIRVRCPHVISPSKVALTLPFIPLYISHLRCFQILV